MHVGVETHRCLLCGERSFLACLKAFDVKENSGYLLQHYSSELCVHGTEGMFAQVLTDEALQRERTLLYVVAPRAHATCSW